MIDYADRIEKTKSKFYIKNKPEFQKEYWELIGNPCYSFSKEAKEKFFEDTMMSFMFLMYVASKGIEKKGEK